VCGWRIGYCVADQALSRRIAQRQSALVNPPSTPAQLALSAFPSIEPVYLDEARNRARRRLGVVGEALQSCGFDVPQPEGAFYLWFHIKNELERGGWTSSTDWCEALAARHGVGLWPGDDYLAPGWVRCSAVACSDGDLESSAAELAGRLTRHRQNSKF
jgi:aspartate/methionine/tyrosine aminotransferase